MQFRPCETDLIRLCSLKVIFEEKLIKHLKMDGRLMQHACHVSLASFLEAIIDILNILIIHYLDQNLIYLGICEISAIQPHS